MLIEALILYLIDYSAQPLRTLDNLIMLTGDTWMTSFGDIPVSSPADVAFAVLAEKEGDMNPAIVLYKNVRWMKNYTGILTEAHEILLMCKRRTE